MLRAVTSLYTPVLLLADNLKGVQGKAPSVCWACVLGTSVAIFLHDPYNFPAKSA